MKPQISYRLEENAKKPKKTGNGTYLLSAYLPLGNVVRVEAGEWCSISTGVTITDIPKNMELRFHPPEISWYSGTVFYLVSPLRMETPIPCPITIRLLNLGYKTISFRHGALLSTMLCYSTIVDTDLKVQGE